MKKYLVAICLLSVVLCCACAASDKGDSSVPEGLEEGVGVNVDLGESPLKAGDSSVLEIKDKVFIAQTTDIMLNASSYEGKTVKVEGMYFGYFDDYDNRDYHYVQRRSPGCCGNDGLVGFEFIYDGDMPELDDWIEAIGQVEVFKVGENERARLRLSQLTVKEERGMEFVNN